jgi:peptidoglycan LD-endopeptidase LytH
MVLVAGRPTGADGHPAAGRVPVLVPAVAPALLTRAEYLDSLAAVGAEPPSPWADAAATAISAAPLIRAPYVERGRFTGLPDALGYRVEVMSGERLEVVLEAGSGDSLFLEIFEERPRDATAGEAAASPVAARAGDGRLTWEAERDGIVVLRLQPRPGAAPEYTLRLGRSAALVFPVADESAEVIGHFLEARDDGARLHRGVDIRAPRGTHVVAAADGVVERVEETLLGGLVVWLRESRTDRTHYYAHLDRQLVTAGRKVSAGDVLGTVGTTGNAPPETPHLHFGVYRDDNVALDPLPFIRPALDNGDDEPAADGPAPRSRARTRVDGAAFRPSSDGQGRAVALARGTEVEVVAEVGRLRRVRTPGGGDGFLAAWLLEPLAPPPGGRER